MIAGRDITLDQAQYIVLPVKVLHYCIKRNNSENRLPGTALWLH